MHEVAVTQHLIFGQDMEVKHLEALQESQEEMVLD